MPNEDDPKDIAFSGQINEREHWKIHLATYPRIFTFWPWLYLVAIVIGLVTADLKAVAADPLQNLPATLLLGAFAIFLFVTPRRSARKAWQSSAGIGDPFSGVLSGTGLSWQGEYGQGHYPWKTLYGYRSRGEILLVYNEMHQTLFLLPRFFASAEEWEAAQALVSNQLRPR